MRTCEIMENSALLSENSSSETLPRLLGQFELVYEFAAGGMATVYLAQLLKSETPARLFAIKQCHPHLRHQPEFSAMFVDEARLSLLLRHPNVIETMAINDEQLYLVMEF